MPDELKKKLADARKLLANKDRAVKKAIFELAAEKYAPAQPLIMEMLDSPDASWRDSALSALAQWDEWPPEFFERVRKVLAEDKDENVRVSAAGLLGANINKWPDPALQAALEKDESRRVRAIALESALLLAGMTWPEVQAATAKAQAGNLDYAAFVALVDAWKKKKKGKS